MQIKKIMVNLRMALNTLLMLFAICTGIGSTFSKQVCSFGDIFPLIIDV